MNIATAIKNLILTHETVVIPGFGTLVMVHRPAELKKSKNILLPPARIFQFNESLKSDDKVLSRYIQSQYKLTGNQADEAIGKFVAGLLDMLNIKGEAKIGGIGTFKKDDAGIIQFEAFDDFTGQNQSFGLPVIEIPKQDTGIQPPEKIFPLVETTTSPVKKKRNVWIPATIVLFIAALVLMLYYTGSWTQLVEKTNHIIGYRKNPDKIIFGKRAESGKDTLQEIVNKQLNNLTDREKALMYKEADRKSVKTDSVFSAPSQNQQTINGSLPYHIIAGAYLIPNNAERQKAKLEEKGLQPTLLPPIRDFYMVSLGSYQTAEEAQIAMDKLHHKYILSLWILKI